MVTSMRKIPGAIIAVLMFSTPFIGHTQAEGPKPREFYRENFVTPPHINGPHIKGGPTRSSRLPVKSQTIPKNPPSQTSNQSPTPDSGPDNRTPLLGEDLPLVRAIGLIVSTTDRQHLKETLTEYLKVLKQRDLPGGPLYLIGHPSRSPQINLISQAAIMGGVVYLRDAIPERYQVTRSPAWLLATDRGLHIIEGTSN